MGIHIAPLICKSVAKTGKFYEPFLGGNNFYHRIYPVRDAVLSDIDQSLITLYNGFLAGWSPPNFVSEELYNTVKNADDPLDPLTAFVSYGCSWGGKKWNGYARGEKKRNYAANALTSLIRTVKPASYVYCSYLDIDIDAGTIYADPPYRNTTPYKTGDFNYDEFYQWCRQLSTRGVEVFVSEYWMPEDFLVVYEHSFKNNLGGIGRKKQDVVERLYRL